MGLLGRLEVAETDSSGHLILNPKCSEVYIDVGASNYGGFVDELLGASNYGGFLRVPPHVCVVAFEPRIDAWASLIARSMRGKHTHKSSLPLGQFHPRGLVLPYAVSDVDGEGTLNVAVADGCSSLLSPRTRAADLGEYAATNPKQSHVNGTCTDVDAVRRVPTIRLDTVLASWLPRHVRASRLKVDAQGMDIAIVESGKGQLHTFDGITMETYPTDCPPFYKGQPMCSEVLQRMGALGFKPSSGRFAAVGAAACFKRENINRVTRQPSCQTLDIIFVRSHRL